MANDNINIGLDASGSGNLDFIAVNPLLESITANISVTPVFTNGDANISFEEFEEHYGPADGKRYGAKLAQTHDVA